MSTYQYERGALLLTPLVISTDREFEAKMATDVTTQVDIGAFSRGTSVHVEIYPTGIMPLKLPRVVGANAAALSIQKPAGMPDHGEGFLRSSRHPNMTISRMPDAICLPGGVAFGSRGTRLLSESFGASWEPQPHHHIAMTGQKTFCLKKSATVERLLQGKYFYLDSQHIGHFGHLLLDNLSRLWAYKLCSDFLGIPDLRILTRPLIAEVRACLHAYGIRHDLVQELNEPVVCEELFVGTKSLQIQDYTSPLMPPILRQIRDGLDNKQSYPKRIYISRRNSPLRRLTNEGAVEDMFRRKGFEVFVPSDFGSFSAQVTAFSGADLLAGCSGTNMYATGFQSKMRGAFVICSPLLVHYAEAFLQEGHASELTWYLGEIDSTAVDFDASNVNCPWHIPYLEDLEAEVDRWLALYL